MKVALQLTEALAVFLVIFYLYCRSPAFRPLRPDWPRPRGKVRLFLVFTGIAILGNYLGVPVVEGQAIVNARAVGATLFMMVVLERQRDQDRVAAMSSARALKVAERTLRLLARGIGRETAGELAAIIKEESGVGAVGVTDTERVLGWAGMGGDHHLPGNPIASPYTRQSIADNAVVFTDGVHQTYDCTVSAACQLNSMVIAPLQVDGVVVGTVQLFERVDRRFHNMNKSLGEGLV